MYGNGKVPKAGKAVKHDAVTAAAGAVTTAAATTMTHLEQANAWVDLASGIIACAAGLATAVWITLQIVNFVRTKRKE